MGSRFERLGRRNVENIRRLLGADRKVSPVGQPVGYPGSPKRAKASVAGRDPKLNSDAREILSHLAQQNIELIGVPLGFFDEGWHTANRSCARSCLTKIDRDVSFWKRVIDFGFRDKFHRANMSKMTYVKRVLLPRYVLATRDRPGNIAPQADKLWQEQMIRKGDIIGVPNPELDIYFDAQGNRRCPTGKNST